MQQNWPSYWNGKKKVSGTAAALHYIKEHTKDGHFRGLLEETQERAIKQFVKNQVDEMFKEASRPNVTLIK